MQYCISAAEARKCSVIISKRNPLRIIFAGTPEFAVPALNILQQSKHQVVLVLTQPDRPAGRGRKLQASPVKEYALQNGLLVAQPTTLKDPQTFQKLAALKPDLMIVIAYGLIIPQTILDLPPHGCLCLHLSLLPRWRGAAPAQRALLAGDNICGVTLFKMDAGIDTGPMLAHATLYIDKNDTTGTLYARLGKLAATTLQENLAKIEQNKITLQQQDHASMTYAVKIDKAEACINWQLSAKQIERMIRAFNPWPIAYTTVAGERLRLWQAEVISELSDSPPGMIIGANKNELDIATGAGILRIKQLQWPSSKIQTAQEALNANQHPFKVGVVCGDDRHE